MKTSSEKGVDSLTTTPAELVVAADSTKADTTATKVRSLMPYPLSSPGDQRSPALRSKERRSKGSPTTVALLGERV
jgi:hypothetical protein